MNDILFSELFRFYDFNLLKYHYTDNRAGAPDHYIAYMNKGSCRLVSESRTVEIAEGDVFYIPMGLSYQSYWYGNDEIQFKSLGFKFFPEAASKRYCLQKIACSAALKERINRITVNCPVSCKTVGEFFTALSELLPLMEAESLSREKEIVRKAGKYISENTDCCAKDIAKHCGVSEATLYSAFKSAGKKTPNDTRLEILCDKAVIKLSTTDKSVQEISDTLGFSSTSYFRKILKAHTGMTPREIRKKNLF